MILFSLFNLGDTYIEGVSTGNDWFDYVSTTALVGIALFSYFSSRASVKASEVSARASEVSAKASEASLELSKKIAENYDAKKMFIQNQIDSVCTFIRDLNTYYLQMAAPQKDFAERESIITSSVHFATLDEAKAKNISSDFTNRQLSITDEFSEVMGAINNFSKEIYFPLEIKMELEKLQARCSDYPEELRNKNHFTFLTFTKSEYFTFDPKYVKKIFPANNVYLDVSSYLLQLAKVKKTAKDWLALYGINANI